MAPVYATTRTGSIALGAFLGGLVVEEAGIVPLLWATAAVASAVLLIGLVGPGPKRVQPAR